jgi:PAS domain S-box-containing protein
VPQENPHSANIVKSGSEEKARLDALLDEALTESFRISDRVAIESDDRGAGDAVSDISDVLAPAILSTRSDAIIAADLTGVIRFWNPGAQRIFGFARAEAIGQSLDIIIPPRLRQRHWDGYDRAMQTGRSRYGEGDVLAVPAVRKDGGQISIEFTVVLLRSRRGEIAGVAAVLRDVTKRFEEMRTLKRQLAAAQAS